MAAITGFHQDTEGDWVAELSCGHNQHVRHNPPFQLRPWVLTPASRAGRLGTLLPCPLCDEARTSPAARPTAPASDEGGDPACWAGLLCPECGAMLIPGEPHRDGCSAVGR